MACRTPSMMQSFVWLLARGEATCRLWVLEENHRARRFYERRGWRLDGRRKDARFPPFPPAVGYTLPLNSGAERI